MLDDGARDRELVGRRVRRGGRGRDERLKRFVLGRRGGELAGRVTIEVHLGMHEEKALGGGKGYEKRDFSRTMMEVFHAEVFSCE